MKQRLQTFTRDNLTFKVIDQGPLDGDVVILLHGFPQRATCWDEVTPILNQAGYRTLALDQRGYTPGARPKGRKAYKVENLAGDVVALMDEIGEKAVHLVGHDWGSFVGYSVAGLYPERVKTYTSVSLPHPKAFRESFFSSRQWIHSWYMAFFQLPKLPEIMLINLKGIRNKQLSDSGMDQVMLDCYQEEMVDEGALTGGINWYRAFPYFASIPKITVPTTHVWSRQDNSLEEKGARLNEKYMAGDYTLKIIDKGNHWLPDQNPTEVAQAILERVKTVS
ncbi:alpha/beta fold hydrolase [Streptococcus mutans]|uniref:alpha/beta fold hydrolase n=1 Tax=Streptococcus mutans TaxID=1309 RepID=UPI0002B59CB2|nr:alpha/beta fold hydrolase [Streptococcus mutans]EMC39662.1 alpha/beta fold family hydrolase [Streptococcus mutans 66-2A]MCB5067120.1 alpha/beta fold hydrolase [Streptococcus mutans]MCB5116397.1 alpha/beta fold hydrolase [Streptococcus mutans]MDW5543923.1 alpha/beta fold hydrolase [Streptococcus mutans]MDW5547521.1 alpha/beta fold hydrolase [Streptococcus mutans]